MDLFERHFIGHVKLIRKVITALITQSNYIPWKGYFDNLNRADVFVVYDDMQYTKRDWRNRNQIKTKEGLKWLTIPVHTKGKYYQKINETVIAQSNWNINHIKQIRHAYRNAQFYKEYFPWIESLYLSATHEYLTDINMHFINAINEKFDITSKIIDSREFNLKTDKTQRLIDICFRLRADKYITGVKAKSYINEELFEEAGIKIIYADYAGYKMYKQIYPPFIHKVCIWDVILNCGKTTMQYIQSNGHSNV